MSETIQLSDLIERYNGNAEAYKSSQYNETQLRREFLDPFFDVLGWDVENRNGYAEAYKDVVHEDAIKIGGVTKAPDYSFRIGGTRKFFVEAKKPSIRIKDDPDPAFQLRRYAWSAKLPLSILTNFEEFAVYDCRIKPDKTDKASTGRILYFTYIEYEKRWAEIASIFSREAVLKGSFDKYAESSKTKKGTAEVDAAFLKEIESWREMLARILALRNPGLSQRNLNFTVQTTIDRIIFLRICEDRGIEDYGRLLSLQNGTNVYERLCQLFRQADERYNSGLFHFRAEKMRPEPPDDLTLSLLIDDKVIKEIIKNLYYPDSPYEFSVLSADILGQVYEQFLGKVIHLTTGHRAIIEDKPEVKKAGGVYYTPRYIVDYIVKNTVGKLLEGKTPKQAANIKILDPACGSGSFLIGAYQYLLDWHRDWYSSHTPERFNPARGGTKWAKGKSPALYQASGGERFNHAGGGTWRLTTGERKRILLNNIYGVDIDTQAVEVTKLSLLLKVLEGETEQSISQQMALFHERALPDLSNNIKCGNSLIGPDFYDGRQGGLFDDEERYRINVFDWEVEFTEVFKAGGFDVVIGNPPYLRIQGLTENYTDQLVYYSKMFVSAVKRFDFYLLFIERGYSLIKKDGILGYICPNKFINSDFGSGLREYLIKNKAIDSFISFGNNLVFNSASTYTSILLLTNKDNRNFRYYEFPNIGNASIQEHINELTDNYFTEYNIDDFDSGPWVLSYSGADKVLLKISRFKKIDSCFSNIFQGVVTGVDSLYFLRACHNEKMEDGVIDVFSDLENRTVRIERAILKPILKGEDVVRYEVPVHKYYTIYPYKEKDGKTVILQEKEFSRTYPLAYKYISIYKNKLHELRVKYKTNPTYWYSCHRGREISLFEQQRIITPEISLGSNMTISPSGLYHNTQVYSFVPKADCEENLNYWLGILNSTLMWFFMKNTGTFLRGGYVRYKTDYLKPFPVRTIDFSNPADVALHSRMVSLVEQMLALHKQLAEAKTPHDKTAIQRQIDAIDRQIDRLVYELYGLTEEEIKIVESNRQ